MPGHMGRTTWEAGQKDDQTARVLLRSLQKLSRWVRLEGKMSVWATQEAGSEGGHPLEAVSKGRIPLEVR